MNKILVNEIHFLNNFGSVIRKLITKGVGLQILLWLKNLLNM